MWTYIKLIRLIKVLLVTLVCKVHKMNLANSVMAGKSFDSNNKKEIVLDFLLKCYLYLD